MNKWIDPRLQVVLRSMIGADKGEGYQADERKIYVMNQDKIDYWYAWGVCSDCNENKQSRKVWVHHKYKGVMRDKLEQFSYYPCDDCNEYWRTKFLEFQKFMAVELNKLNKIKLGKKLGFTKQQYPDVPEYASVKKTKLKRSQGPRQKPLIDI